MVSISGTSIKMTRGDTLRVTISMIDEEGNEYTPMEGDVIRFAAKKYYLDAETKIHKIIPNDTLLLELEPEDTKNLPFGEYVYDIEITFADGVVDTFIANAHLILDAEVL